MERNTKNFMPTLSLDLTLGGCFQQTSPTEMAKENMNLTMDNGVAPPSKALEDCDLGNQVVLGILHFLK